MSNTDLTEADKDQPGKPEPSILLSKGSDPARRFLLERKAKDGQNQIVNPQTPPSRFISSTYSSPGSILGKEDDAIIIELNPRYLYAGIEGESGPQCKISFNPDSDRRVGDFRIWQPGYVKKPGKLETFGQQYELWQDDIKGMDLGLAGDKLERAVREAYNKQLLVDAGSARLVLVIPSIVPHPVLETILSTFFEKWKYPTITLLPSPTMATIAAGLRSALVIDIGWQESIVTSVYEYREILSHRSTRAMKMLARQLTSRLTALAESKGRAMPLRLDLEFLENLMARVFPCIDLWDTRNKPNSPTDAPDISKNNSPTTPGVGPHEIEIEWPAGIETEIVRVPTSLFSSAVKDTFFDEYVNEHPDDHELAISMLLFRSLQAISPDVRSLCMSRMVFIGAGAAIPGLKSRVLHGVENLIQQSGWANVKGEHIRPQRNGHLETKTRARSADAKHDVQLEAGKDYVEERVRKQKSKTGQAINTTELREVVSLGSWAGASLLTSLKVRGFVEVERERFLSHGLSGASRDSEISVVPQPQRMSSFGISKPVKIPDRSSWTLAGWG